MLIRMFWIFPAWTDRLSRLEKGLIAFIIAGVFVAVFYMPVVGAYRRRNGEAGTKSQEPPAVDRKPPATSAPNVQPIPAAKPTKHPSIIQSNPAPLPSIGQSNSGGINVQQATAGKDSPIIDSPITIGDVPRRIAPQDMIALTQYLTAAQGKAHLRIAVQQNSNAVKFAEDFYKVFQDAGWPMDGDGVAPYIGFGPPGKKLANVSVTVKGEPLKPNETVYFNAPDPMLYIGKVIEALKLSHALTREQNQPDGVISISFQGFAD
jgi:hypothetical protein